MKTEKKSKKRYLVIQRTCGECYAWFTSTRKNLVAKNRLDADTLNDECNLSLVLTDGQWMAVEVK